MTALGNIRETDRLSEVMLRNGVESIFHAAAYKHVPMMESHVLEAVRNNVLGTWNLVRAARGHNVRSLLMISSDKAVNPICVMGATKRVCERIVSARCPGNAQTRCVSVRFGNVLGSNGSVVPMFQEQIAAGGPIKVTHPEARRFFMTISEAVSLVVQASTRSQGSEIFVLDMGEPIRIVDLAENMIRLAGKVPYEEIDIQFTGLRPGEKLIEEIRGKSEGLIATSSEKMHVIREQPLVLGPGGWLDRRTEAPDRGAPRDGDHRPPAEAGAGVQPGGAGRRAVVGTGAGQPAGPATFRIVRSGWDCYAAWRLTRSKSHHRRLRARRVSGQCSGALPGTAGTPHRQGLRRALVHRARPLPDEPALPEDARSRPRRVAAA